MTGMVCFILLTVVDVISPYNPPNLHNEKPFTNLVTNRVKLSIHQSLLYVRRLTTGGSLPQEGVTTESFLHKDNRSSES